MRYSHQESWTEWFREQYGWPLVAALISLVVLGGGTLIETHYQDSYQDRQDRIVDQNAFWQMVAAGESDDSDLGRLAGEIQPLLAEDNPAKALLSHYVEPESYPEDLSETLGVEIFTDTQNKSYQEQYVPNHGYFSPEFTVLALQATPELIESALVELDPDGRPDSPYFLWQHAAVGVTAPWVAFLLIGVVRGIFLSAARKRAAAREGRAEKQRKLENEKRIQEAPEAAQDIMRIIARLEALPSDPQVRKLLKQAQKDLAEALSAPQLEMVDKKTALARIESDLEGMRESRRIQAEVYADLHQA